MTERSSFSSEMEVAKFSGLPNFEVRFVSCNESAIKRWLSSELEEIVFSLTHELFMTKHHTITLTTAAAIASSHLTTAAAIAFSHLTTVAAIAFSHKSFIALKFVKKIII